MADYVGRETFCMTYGDGVSDVNIRQLLDFHTANGLFATLTAIARRAASVHSAQRAKVDAFQEKPVGDGGWINGGFFVLSPAVLDYIAGDGTVWEQERSSASHAKVSWRPIVTRGSGSRWTRYATSANSKALATGARRGRRGDRRSGLLARSTRPRHRAHGLQGCLAQSLARPAGGPRHGFALPSTTSPKPLHAGSHRATDRFAAR